MFMKHKKHNKHRIKVVVLKPGQKVLVVCKHRKHKKHKEHNKHH